MVKLNFNLHGYQFQESAKVLLASFQSAARALKADVKQAEADAIAYQNSLAQGGPWIGELDEDGHVLWDQETILEMQLEASGEALMGLRKAFVIALYHHWERAIRVTTSDEKANHNELVRLAIAKGIAINPKLGAVRDLVNALKHNRDKWGNDLLQSWSDVFRPGFLSRGVTDWYFAIQLTDEHVSQAFDIVTSSGPNRHSL